jgi:TRAP-type C4-dicarboxylate transport system permease small subunit
VRPVLDCRTPLVFTGYARSPAGGGGRQVVEHTVRGVGRLLNALAASWMFLLAFVVLVDVVGRGLFNAPLVGTPEIIANSVVAVTFLQLPYAISAGSMIHTPIVLDLLPGATRRFTGALIMLSGAIVFAVLAYASFEPTLRAYETGEYFGEGALRVPTVYTRALILAMSVLATIAYLTLVVGELKGRGLRAPEAGQ